MRTTPFSQCLQQRDQRLVDGHPVAGLSEVEAGLQVAVAHPAAGNASRPTNRAAYKPTPARLWALTHLASRRAVRLQPWMG